MKKCKNNQMAQPRAAMMKIKNKMHILSFSAIVGKKIKNKKAKIRFIKTNFFILDRNVINLRNRKQSI